MNSRNVHFKGWIVPFWPQITFIGTSYGEAQNNQALEKGPRSDHPPYIAASSVPANVCPK